MRVAATLLLLATLCVGVQSNGEYEVGSEVVLYANKVGPFANPNEVYAFYSLPYCAPTEIETKRENLGALLKGDRPTKTRYDLKFRTDVPWKSLCKVELGDPQAAKFKQAIVDDYYFEMLLDELPIWGYVGELETKSVNFEREFDNSTRYYLFTHLDFSIAYNDRHIIEVNVSADPLPRGPRPERAQDRVLVLGQVARDLHAPRGAHEQVRAVLVPAAELRDPLALHHQLFRAGAAADGLPVDHPDACAEE
jgi:hypothetical protein